MIKFFIRIDRKSIRKNPNGGNTTYVVPGRPKTREVYEDGVLIEKLVSYPCQYLHSLTPEPHYFYDYEDTEVECSNCHERFSYTKLESDCVDDVDYFHDSKTICPICKGWDCCEIQKEKLNNEELHNLWAYGVANP